MQGESDPAAVAAAAVVARFETPAGKSKPKPAGKGKKEVEEPPPHVPTEAVIERMLGTSVLTRLVAVRCVHKGASLICIVVLLKRLQHA